jgi:hypothetical protein
VASHTVCTFTQDAEQIRDGVVIFFFSPCRSPVMLSFFCSSYVPATAHGVPLQVLALLDGHHGSKDRFLDGLYVLVGYHVMEIWGKRWWSGLLCWNRGGQWLRRHPYPLVDRWRGSWRKDYGRAATEQLWRRR